MGHYISGQEVYKVKFRPGYEKTDFENWWKKQSGRLFIISTKTARNRRRIQHKP